MGGGVSVSCGTLGLDLVWAKSFKSAQKRDKITPAAFLAEQLRNIVFVCARARERRAGGVCCVFLCKEHTNQTCIFAKIIGQSLSKCFVRLGDRLADLGPLCVLLRGSLQRLEKMFVLEKILTNREAHWGPHWV